MAALADPEKNLVAELGILGIEIDPRTVTAGSGLREPYGIVVAARAAGARTEVPLAPRDVIRSINGTKTFTLYQLRTALQALKPGFSALVDRANVPIVPVALDGAHEAYPRGAKFPRPAKIVIVVGEPIPASTAREMDDRELVDLVADRLRALHAEARRRR